MDANRVRIGKNNHWRVLDGRVLDRWYRYCDRADPVKYTEALGATGLRIDHAEPIATTLREAFDTPGLVLIGVHADCRENRKTFERPAFYNCTSQAATRTTTNE
ncbi:MAG: acetolactate synthase, catabolic [Candidatus Solibacter sp.]|nr:acetolactate synthase, catabolic [Candidatus Solibacter sp.]